MHTLIQTVCSHVFYYTLRRYHCAHNTQCDESPSDYSQECHVDTTPFVTVTSPFFQSATQQLRHPACATLPHTMICITLRLRYVFVLCGGDKVSSIMPAQSNWSPHSFPHEKGSLTLFPHEKSRVTQGVRKKSVQGHRFSEPSAFVERRSGWARVPWLDQWA